jgi:hypothetical protein
LLARQQRIMARDAAEDGAGVRRQALHGAVLVHPRQLAVGRLLGE